MDLFKSLSVGDELAYIDPARTVKNPMNAHRLLYILAAWLDGFKPIGRSADDLAMLLEEHEKRNYRSPSTMQLDIYQDI